MIKKLKKLAQMLCDELPVLCADMEILHEDDPERVLFGYSNGWATTFWVGESSFPTTSKGRPLRGIKFCHVYCKNGTPDYESEETRIHFAPTPETALSTAMVECYKRELEPNLGIITP